MQSDDTEKRKQKLIITQGHVVSVIDFKHHVGPVQCGDLRKAREFLSPMTRERMLLELDLRKAVAAL